MIIGIPKEIKNNENRVGANPAGVQELVKHGQLLVLAVVIQTMTIVLLALLYCLQWKMCMQSLK